MKFNELNPFIRFAECVHFSSSTNLVMVSDCRLLYIISGQATIDIQNQHYSLNPGSMFYCCKGSIYNLESEHIEYLCLNFDLTQQDSHHTELYPRIHLTNSSSESSIEKPFVSDCPFLGSHLFIENALIYARTVEAIIKEHYHKKLLYREASSSLLKSLLAELHRHCQYSSPGSADAITKTIEYIDSHYSEQINNHTLAELTGYHEYYLNRLFLKHMNISLHQYIIRIRIQEAQKMLLNTNMPLAEIALQTGFNSNTHFSTYFKQFTGSSPSVFRKLFKNQI